MKRHTTMAANPMALIRIVDDDEALRESLKFLLKTEGWNTVSYSSCREFLDKDNPLIPGCLVLDIRMPGMSGLELQEELRNRDYSLPILFITAHGDIDMAVEALKKGAFDFLTKPIDDERLLKNIAEASEKDFLNRSHQINKVNWEKSIESLTPREMEVARLVAQGRMNKIIASELGITERTVKIHRAAVCRKLGVRSAVEISKILESVGQ